MEKLPEPQPEPTERSYELAALLAAAHAVLDNRAFPEAVRTILEACKTILGAEAGLIAVRVPGGAELEVSVLDSGSLALDPAAGLPAPLVNLGARVVETKAVLVRDLSKECVPAAGAGGPNLPESALLAPILIGGEVAGLVGLLNKPGGFSESDSRLAEVFAEMAAVAMLNSRTVSDLQDERRSLQSDVRQGATDLQEAEEEFRVLVEGLPDVVARFDRDLRHLYVSPAIRGVTGRPPSDFVGRTNRELGFAPELVGRSDAALRKVFATGQPERLEFAFESPERTRHFDCRLLPLTDSRGEVASVMSVARDVSDLREALDNERRARFIADALREATVALTSSLDRETVLTTLLDRLRGMVPFDRASVMLLEEAKRVSVRAVFDGDRIVPLTPEARTEFDPTRHPIVHGILTSGKPVLIPDVRDRADWSLPTEGALEACWMGVPLFARGSVAGLFSLSKREAGYFNDEHLRLAEAMSSQASVAVENAVLFEQMQASTARMQSLSRRLVDAQESERRHIARELHDEAGQALASLRIGLRLLEREIDEGGSAQAQVTELVRRTDDVIDGLHRLAADLRPASLDHLGLEAALRQYSKSAASKFDLDVHFKARGFTAERLSPHLETALYRVVQEAMTNVARHAHATRVDVLVECRDGRVLVMVEDNGVGFDPARGKQREHLGLLGMKERAEDLGGTMTVESSPGAGTTIVVEVPIADSHPDR